MAGADHVPVAHSELLEISEGHRQSTVLPPAMFGELDLEADQDPVSGQAEHAYRRRAQHLDRARDELPADPPRVSRLRFMPPLRAKAIWRERTQERTSGVGGIGSGVRPKAGRCRIFPCICAPTQPGL